MKKPQLIHSWLLTIMRITFIQFFLAFLFSSVSLAYESSAQALLEQKITLQVQDQKVSRILNQIEKKTNIRFVFSSALIGSDRKASLIAKDIALSEVLDQLLVPLQVSYEVSGKVIILHRNKADKTQSLSPEEGSEETEFNVSGKVTDDQGEPIPGVNIVLKGTSTGSSTDVNGNYTVSLPDASATGTLIFSYIGFITQEVAINNQTTVDVKLLSDVKALSEVVVVGYGSQKRSDITGSVTSVPKDRFEKLPVTNVTQAIQGAVAGVVINQGSTVPGTTGGLSIRVRGDRSLRADNAPYIILDEVPFPGTFNDINPNDVESMEILKDASATAIYGTRGANGVILITTKRGKSGKPMIRYNGYGGPEYMAHKLEMMDGPAYVAKYAEFKKQRNDPNPNPVPNSGELPNYQAGNETDWIREVSQQGSIQSHNVSVSGGTEDVKYYLSGEYLKQQGVLKNYQYQRIGLRSNLDANVTKWLKLGTSLFFINNNDGGSRVDLTNAMAMSPYGQLYDAKGNYAIYPMNPELLYVNPLLGLNATRESRGKNMTSTFYAEIKPAFLKGLKYRLNGNYSYMTGKGNTYSGRAANDVSGGTANINNYESDNWTIENILSYSKDFGLHHVDVTTLYSAQENSWYNNGMNAQGFINDQLDYFNIGTAEKINSIYSNTTRRGLLSQMGRINYSFASRYLFTATARRDGSSVFGAGTTKYATFPSVAVGWNIAKEGFMSNASAINMMKLRLSYGTSGTEAISPYQTLSLISPVKYIYNGASVTGIRTSSMGNANLKWESTTSLNLGLDFALLNSRIIGTIEVYDSKTKDILLPRQLPMITGYSGIWDNIGQTASKGLEVTLSTLTIEKGDFTWETSLNFATYENKIASLYGDNKDDIVNRWFIGKPLGALYDYKLVGIWQEGEDPSNQDPGAKPGDLKFEDIDNDKKITDKDRMYLGSSQPDYVGGITNNFRYKGFNLRIFIQTVQGGLRGNPLMNRADYAGRINQPAEVGYWTAENKSNTRPSLGFINPRGYGYPMDASFTRIKDITLSYVVQQKLLEKLQLSSLSLYVSGRNIYTFTDWIGWDPEQSYNAGTSVNYNNYPNVASYIVGLSIGLK